MKYIMILCLLLSPMLIVGCASVNTPNAERFFPPWGGGAALHLGDSKDYVRSTWGDPDEIKQVGIDDVGLIVEEWIYSGKFPVIEIDPKILVKGDTLIFTGSALTGYKSKQ